MSVRCLRYALLLVLILAIAAGQFHVAEASPVALQDVSPEQQLADKYAPIAYLKQQTEPCDTDGEPYVPAPVDIVFDDPAVSLEQGDPATVVAVAPAATALANTTEDDYLNLPGNPRQPKCTYEQHSKERMQGQSPTTYANIVVDDDEGKLALEYWFYYYFNDFNNTHESDWEMILVLFDATSAEEALTKDPYQVGFAQHGGGELADWNDAKFTREGNHPIVYPAAGSHATYYGSHVYLGWGENGTGFGCDYATGPSNRTELQPVLVPDNPDSNGPFSWLLFQGRWGERQPWEFNGPKGPNLGKKWTDPFSAVENWRDSSLKVPDRSLPGPDASDVFCTLSAAGSQVLIIAGVYPWASLIFTVTLIAAVAFLIFKIWIVVRAAWDVYSAHFRTFLGIGLLTIPIGILFSAIQILLSRVPPLDWVIQWFDDTDSARLFTALGIGVFQQITMLLVISPAVIEAIREIREGKKPEVVRTYQLGFQNFRRLAGSLAILLAVLAILAVSIIGIPIAIFVLIRWQFFGQAVILDGAPTSRIALGHSSGVVKGKWWLAFGASAAFQLLGYLPGPLVGVMLLIFAGSTVEAANLISSLIYAVSTPLLVIGLTIVYLHLSGRLTAHDIRAAAKEEQPLRPEEAPA